ncbi:hypothetical protein HHK36_030343 [Tetracentron sinense]|uniref:TTF-type domain-containing protein n=1 Tax=Tetracentron sinense TaxID=13715 RepID=A0A835CY56_TETSI|nr:hypothetical protein HHK36_030343 [Tetracentron sinense]
MNIMSWYSNHCDIDGIRLPPKSEDARPGDKKCDSLWKAWKNNLWTKWYNPLLSLDDQMTSIDRRAILEQWRAMVIIGGSKWRRENRAHLRISHTVGTWSFTQYRVDAALDLWCWYFICSFNLIMRDFVLESLDSKSPKRKISQNLEANSSSPTFNLVSSSHDCPLKLSRIEHTEVNMNSLVRDPGLRLPIWDYPIDQCDEIRCAYIKVGPYQHIFTNYPLFGSVKHQRRFQSSWFKLFPPWLQYSASKDAAFCLPYYLFTKKPTGRPASSAFTIEGFRNWRKVNDGENYAFLSHVGKDPISPHNVAERSYKDLMSQSLHIEKILQKQTFEQVGKNRLRLKTSINTVRWLTFQACVFRGHDECPNSKNRDNFLEMIKILASFNGKVADVVLENAIGNAKYTS